MAGIIGHCLAVRTSPAQIGTGFQAGGSQRESLARLDDPEKAIVLVGVAVETKFIHSQGVIHRDLKSANIPLGEQGYSKIDDLVNGGFGDLRLRMTSDVGRLLHMGRATYEPAGYTTAVEVYAFAQFVCEMFLGERAFSAALSPGVLMKNVAEGSKAPLPEPMDAAIQKMIEQGSSLHSGPGGP